MELYITVFFCIWDTLLHEIFHVSSLQIITFSAILSQLKLQVKMQAINTIVFIASNTFGCLLDTLFAKWTPYFICNTSVVSLISEHPISKSLLILSRLSSLAKNGSIWYFEMEWLTMNHWAWLSNQRYPDQTYIQSEISWSDLLMPHLGSQVWHFSASIAYIICMFRGQN